MALSDEAWRFLEEIEDCNDKQQQLWIVELWLREYFAFGNSFHSLEDAGLE